MIIPEQITKFDRSQFELEEFALFSILVAGKNARQTARKLESFLFTPCQMGTMTPFEWIIHLNKISNSALSRVTEIHKLGQYKRITRAFSEIVKFKAFLPIITVDDLEQIYGVGRKTASFFVVHSQRNARHAVLDTHILRWLREQGHDAPKSTPTNKKYAELERIFLDYCDQAHKSPAELDLEIWKKYSNTIDNDSR
jgi:hypothetical protein